MREKVRESERGGWWVGCVRGVEDEDGWMGVMDDWMWGDGV